MDETILTLLPPLRKCWMKRGQQKEIPTPGQQERVYLFGTYDWHADEVAWLVADKQNSQTFLAFLLHLMLTCYPSERIILVLDNAPFHRSAFSQAALSLFDDRLLVVWLPRYCSTLNPIERYWKHLKEQVCINKLFATTQDLTDSIVNELEQQNCLKTFRFSKQEVLST
jgi:putative transposase